MILPLDAVHSQRRSVYPRPFDVGFVVNKVAMRVVSSSLSNITRALFLGGRRGTRTPKHFVNLTGESKNFKFWNSR